MVINNIIMLLMAASATIFLFSAAILWKGGWSRNDDPVPPTRLQRHISVSFVIIGINLFLYAGIQNDTTNSHALFREFLDWLSYVPISLLFVQSRILRQQKLTWKHWLIALAPIILDLPLVIAYSGQHKHVLGISYLSIYTYTYQVILYVIALFKLRKWDQQISNEFSDLAHKQTVWFRKLTLPFMFLVVLWIPMEFFPNFQWLIVVYYAIEIVLAIRISEHALKQEEFDFTEMEKNLQINDSPAIIETDVEIPHWVDKLERLMKEEKIYCNPELSITMLSAEVGINRTYLSRYINTSSGGTFYDYVNTFRVKEAEKYLIETDLPISLVAEKSGFASLATFSRYFRSTHNQTPSDFRALHKENRQ